jgi:hypothetical protein
MRLRDQKIDREGAGRGFASAKMAALEASPADPAPRQCKTLKAFAGQAQMALWVS